MKRYNPKEIEPKWRQVWDKTEVYKADLKSQKPKYVAMSMFNYPSGDGIHIGHAMNYTISDVMARFKRQQGYESYHPVGWDSFGLPAENYAIKTHVSPQESMAKIIPNYHKQYKAMGWSNDWTKEIATHEPEYYKWTQWLFNQMFKAGLVYQDSRLQWWCPIDNTVLADEQVTPEGKCWRHDGPNDPPAEKREVKQWFFKITDYADELLKGLEELDWPESIKSMQRNWIGRSEGVEIDFEIEAHKEKIKVFTTRPDTIFGATFLVLAPEHTALSRLKISEQVKNYVKEAERKTEVERQEEGKEKTGVFSGYYAINPANDQKIPIWVADYVLSGYGTGAIMAVPAHDERDEEFAKKFDLPIAEIGEPAAQEKIVEDLTAKKIAKEKTTYKLRDWSVSRQRYWGAPIPIINCPNCGPVLVSDEDLPVKLPELKDFEPSGDGRSALARSKDWLEVKCPKCSGPAERETDTMDTYVCSSWYFLRYFDPRNEKKAFGSEIVNKWMPIDFYNGADHATAHLIYARFITRFFHKQGLINHAEPFQKFLFNGKVTASDGQMFSKSKGNGVDPLEIIAQGYGADALRTYLMFAAPLDQWVRWDPQGVPGTYRFLNRLWTLVQEFLDAKESSTKNLEVERTAHKTIKKVTKDLESQKYNTAIAAMMSAINDLYKVKADQKVTQSESWRFALESLTALVAPLAPFIAEELWLQLGRESSVHIGTWPKWDDNLVTEEILIIAVQVNGKLKGEIEVDSDYSEQDAIEAVKTNEKLAIILDDQKIKKTIHVPGRIINFVI